MKIKSRDNKIKQDSTNQIKQNKISTYKRNENCFTIETVKRNDCLYNVYGGAAFRVRSEYSTGFEPHKPRGLPSIGSLGNMKVVPLGDRNRSPFGW